VQKIANNNRNNNNQSLRSSALLLPEGLLLRGVGVSRMDRNYIDTNNTTHCDPFYFCSPRKTELLLESGLEKCGLGKSLSGDKKRRELVVNPLL